MAPRGSYDHVHQQGLFKLLDATGGAVGVSMERRKGLLNEGDGGFNDGRLFNRILLLHQKLSQAGRDFFVS